MSTHKVECKALIEAADADGDGNIDYEEFADMLFENISPVRRRMQMHNSIKSKDSEVKMGSYSEDSGTINLQSSFPQCLKRNVSRRLDLIENTQEVSFVQSGNRYMPSTMTTVIAVAGGIFIAINLIVAFLM